jgi:hypothetical protein
LRVVKVKGSFLECVIVGCKTNMREKDKWKDGCLASAFKEMTKYEKEKRVHFGGQGDRMVILSAP